MTQVCFPTISADYPDAGGTLIAWFVADGDPVTIGQALAEVSVNKAVGTIEATATGAVRLLCSVQDVVVQGTAIARIDP